MEDNKQLELILSRSFDLETDAKRSEYIDTLEGFIISFNKAYAGGEPIVPDSVYDTCITLLQDVKPNSPLLHQVWSEDDPEVAFEEDLDRFLSSHPMLSIQTVKHLADKPVQDFQAKLPLGNVEVCVSIKENGHGIRIVYKEGHLVRAMSRGRSTNGRDLTRQAQLILGEFNEHLADLDLVEFRGEVLLPFHNLEDARQFNPGIKSAFSGVASMIRESATPEETQLLDIIIYDVITDELDFETLEEKLQYLEDVELQPPLYFSYELTRNSLEEDLMNIVNDMEEMEEDYPYYTDGVVVAINNISLFGEFGSEDKFRLGNLALKIGKWKQDSYIGIVSHIKWEEGKSRKTPVAVLEEGVLTATGNSVVNVPLYAPCYILLAEAYPGRPLHFKYGGEAGVVPIMPDGRLLTDKTFK